MRGEVEHLREGRAQRRSDLNDRSLAPDRGARADGERGGQRLDDRHLPANIAALIEDCVHHLRNAMALCLRCEAIDKKDDHQPPDDRR